MTQNPYLLAADNSPSLLPLLRSNGALASQQDEHGYSLVHAAASYDHLDLLRSLVRELQVPVDLRDEDGETALFVVETVAAAKVLIEELGLDAGIRSATDGLTARERIEADGEFPEVAEYLRGKELSTSSAATGVAVNGTQQQNGTSTTSNGTDLPPAPEGISVTMGTMAEPAEGAEPDPEFRRRIQELAARDDLNAEEAQAQLRQLVQDVVAGQNITTDNRNVRQRQD